MLHYLTPSCSTSGWCARAITALALLVCQQPAQAADESGFFEQRVRPILVERCQSCHQDAKTKGGLKLTSRATLIKGGDSGPAIVPGNPRASLLIRAIGYGDDLKMPPKGKLAAEEIRVLTRWIERGAPWPQAVPVNAAQASGFHITDEQRRFWAFQPLRDPPLPSVQARAWPRSPLDRFILARLEAAGLKPAPAADRATLIRRATFDLIGVPPTPEEVAAFVNDPSPQAFATAIERLLASPAYGERWGRHWLDVVRYTDSFDARGLGSEGDIPFAWRYRDWVVNAFNRDLPYDQFIRQQIAGDLLSPEQTVATGMLAIGNWGGGDADKEKLLTDIADDQVDVVGRAFLGLTLACARCHDHKFDPISTADYYGLAGIFFSSHILPNVGPKTNGPPMLRISLTTKEDQERAKRYTARVTELEQLLKKATENAVRARLSQTSQYLLAAFDWVYRDDNSTQHTLADIAARRKLHLGTLERWVALIGKPAGTNEYRLLHRSVHNVLSANGVHGWRGEPDCPSMLVNSSDKEVKLLTFTLPPRSVAVHPGPKNGVAVSWRSPISGTVRISGRVADADPAGGDGIAWAVDHRSIDGLSELAAGDIPNGGAERFDQAKTAAALSTIRVQQGDSIELLVLPKATHICDTTVVELRIAQVDGPAHWDLPDDMLADPLASNPHPDRLGHSNVWHFLDMAESTRSTLGPLAGSAALARCRHAARQGDRVALKAAVEEFQRTFTLIDERSPFWLSDASAETTLPADVRTRLASLRGELAELKKNPPPPPIMVHGIQEGGVPGSPHAGLHDVGIHIRGSYARLGELVPRRFPVILAGEQQPPLGAGSGRLQLADWLASTRQPLTARVMVNRVWQHHFGEGLVRTPGNFGKLGEAPTDPELLDWLANRFVASGWSIKQLHRLIMLSATYQQAARAEDDIRSEKGQARQRLFGQMNRQRLEAEALRDAMLAVSGRLNRAVGGPASRDLGNPRRSLYLMTIRSDRSGFAPLFDAADPTAIVEKRTVSTIAPQALFLLNHPFVLQQAQALAERVMAQPGDNQTRIGWLYTLLYARPPGSDELFIGLRCVSGPEALSWEAYCQVLLCANEFSYIE